MANGYWQLVTATVAWFTGHAANDKCNCHFMRSHSCVEVGRGLEGVVQLGCKLYPDVTTSWATHTHSLSHWEDVFIALFIFHLHRTEELKELREHKSLDVARS